MSQGGFWHHEQVKNILDMLEVKRRDEITNEILGEDGMPPMSRASRLGRLLHSSWLSWVPKLVKPIGPEASPRGLS
jgi:hypothetical protein